MIINIIEKIDRIMGQNITLKFIDFLERKQVKERFIELFNESRTTQDDSLASYVNRVWQGMGAEYLAISAFVWPQEEREVWGNIHWTWVKEVKEWH